MDKKIDKDMELAYKLDLAMDKIKEKKYWFKIDKKPAWKWIEEHQMHKHINSIENPEEDKALWQ